MNTAGRISIKESQTKMTPALLLRLAGLSAILAGVCFVIVGLFHPLNVPASVTTAAWVYVHIAAVAMCFFGLFGLTGLYVRQIGKAGWLGLAGFALFSAWLALVLAFSFVEAFILPLLAAGSPAFVEGVLAMFTSSASEIDLGILPTLWMISGPLYIVGPLLFGIATFRAGVLPRWAGALHVIGALLVPVGAVVPPEIQPWIMIPHGLALAWLGYALFSERRAPASAVVLDQSRALPEPGKAA